MPAVVVDDAPAPPLARLIAAWGVPLITGRPAPKRRSPAAGLAGAVAVICAQDDDLRTLETALLARRLRDDVRVVAQLTNPAVGRAVKEVGVAVLDVAGLSAPSVVEACLRRGRAGDDAVRRAVPRRPHHRAAPRRRSASCTATLAPVAVVPPDGDVLVCPGRDTEVGAGDEVTIIGTPAELAAAAVIDHPERSAASPPPQPGGGSTGGAGPASSAWSAARTWRPRRACGRAMCAAARLASLARARTGGSRSARWSRC